MRKGHRETHCKRGHEFTDENTYIVSRGKRGGTYRRCKMCAVAKRSTPEMRDYMKRYQRQYQRNEADIVVTDEQVSELLVSQDGLCAICYEKQAVVVDHDHDTGWIRGMLCRGCNLALGLLGDNEEGIRAALEYLTTPRLEEVV